jgi:hypothetical protein
MKLRPRQQIGYVYFRSQRWKSLRRFPALFFVGYEIGTGERLDIDAIDAMAGHLGYGIAAALVLDAFAGGGNVAELGEEKAGEGFDPGFARELPMKLVAEIAE